MNNQANKYDLNNHSYIPSKCDRNKFFFVKIKRQLDATDHLLHLVGVLFSHINDDARSKPH